MRSGRLFQPDGLVDALAEGVEEVPVGEFSSLRVDDEEGVDAGAIGKHRDAGLERRGVVQLQHVTPLRRRRSPRPTKSSMSGLSSAPSRSPTRHQGRSVTVQPGRSKAILAVSRFQLRERGSPRPFDW